MTKDIEISNILLRHILHDHTRAELLEMCSDQGIEKVSGLKKDELVDKMTVDLPRMAAEKMLYWDQPTYKLMKYMATEEDPIYPFEPDDPDDVEEYFLDENIGFALEIERGSFSIPILVIPKELQDAFLALDGTTYRDRVKRNTKVGHLAKGLLHYYGTLTPEELARFLNPLLDEPLDAEEITSIIAEIGGYSWGIYWEDEHLSDYRILDLAYTLKERNSRGDLEYRKLTYEEVWQAGEPGFSESTAEMQALADFVLSTKPGEEAYEFLDAFFGLLQTDMLPMEILPTVLDILELESEREMGQLGSLIFDCYNKTPLWVLKGHTPAQLAPQAKDNVYSLASKKKVGRNDPCPCGSGQKFKRCCGKN